MRLMGKESRTLWNRSGPLQDEGRTPLKEQVKETNQDRLVSWMNRDTAKVAMHRIRSLDCTATIRDDAGSTNK